MIEVEKKFVIEDSVKKQIMDKGVFQKKWIFQDTYFDTEDFTYTKQNIWLRKRNDFYMLKRGIRPSRGSVDVFEEITDWEKIGETLHLPLSNSLETAIEERGLVPYCTFTNIRHSYLIEPFTIDIDEADFGDFSYKVLEIELMVSKLSQVKEGEEKILNFAQELHLDVEAVAKPKLIAYLAQKSPSHFQALVEAKVIFPFTSDLYYERKV